MAAFNSEDDMGILSKYFMETDNIPKEVSQAFTRIKQLHNSRNEESKSDEGLTEGAKKVKSNILTREILLNNKWLFYNDNGYLGEMTFADNGTIQGYHNHNEHSWKLSQGSYGHTILEFYGTNNKRTCQYISAILDVTGKWRLQGPFETNKAWKHYLHQV